MAEVGSGEEQEEEEQIDFEIPSKRRKLLMKYNRFAEDNPDLSEDESKPSIHHTITHRIVVLTRVYIMGQLYSANKNTISPFINKELL